MTAPSPRLRVFAGPNGSGKSTIKDDLPAPWLGVYVNADEIEKTIRAQGYLELSEWGVTLSEPAWHDFLSRSPLLNRAGGQPQAAPLTLDQGRVHLGAVVVNSYHAAALAGLLRQELLRQRISFTFETVMSSRDKVDFLASARQAGFRTYLYYVATEDPAINLSRVAHRVSMGGHPVPEDRIRSRYTRSLGLLSEAVAHTDRAYLFDNSGHERIWIAEVTAGHELEMKTDRMPSWFRQALWDTFEDDTTPAKGP